MKTKITWSVQYLNDHIEDKNDPLVCVWLTNYMHSSYMYEKQNMDKSWLRIQPGWPEEIVTGYTVYSDTLMAFAHKTNRLMINFKSNTQTDISLYKFKRYIRRTSKYKKEDYEDSIKR